MLELKSIVKHYVTGGETVEALKGIDLSFRKSEFVSILGPSGCGKTTLLNIIGGLDQYTNGDLVIDGVSTKEYKDRDWDSYRNHKIGFVFQSYNLIPHQTVLANVELALSLSGVSKKERRERAKIALEKVGLGNQLKKRPNQMSGGQMQRVAIARALVNDPDIILADEPTGALDTETSVQVMDILKEISKERLIIMVTHNPEIAETYSSRIIKMLDGNIIGDSDPIGEDELAALALEDKKAVEKAKTEKKVKKPSLSFGTAFMLSLKNLFTKKGRTILTSFAGSIGIIGISLILAVSEGTTAFIDTKQEEALSSYPITLEASTVELTSVMEAFMNMTSESVEHEKDAVYQKTALANIINAFNNIEEKENDLRAFDDAMKKELSDKESELYSAVNGVQYTYDLDLLVYTENVDGKIIRSDTEKLLTELMIKYMGDGISEMMAFNESTGMGSMTMSSASLWQEMLPGKDGEIINPLIKEQYDLVRGEWPNKENEILLVVDKNNEIDDLTLYALGLLEEEEIDALADASINKTQLDIKVRKWSYDEIMNMEFKTILNSDCYAKDPITGLYRDKREDENELRMLYNNAMELKVVGIIRPDEKCESPMLSGNIAYTHLLTESIIEKSGDSSVIDDQLNSPNTDLITGLPFKSTQGSLTDVEKKEEFTEYISTTDVSRKADIYKKIFAMDIAQQQVANMDRATMEQMIFSNFSSMSADYTEAEVREYIEALSDDILRAQIYDATVSTIESMLENPSMLQGSEAMAADPAYAELAAAMGQILAMSDEELAYALDMAMQAYTDEQFALYHDKIMEFSASSLEANLIEMGYVSLDDPASINIYATTFENKDIITNYIAEYNSKVSSEQQIKYTDLIGIVLSSMTTILNAITYVLIAFVAISLIVSSIMIGVITLISVQERTKEIGILRAIGASKKNVSVMFNAETMIIGFASGLIGVLVTYILCIPINAILYALTEINNLKAFLPVPAAIILVAISVLLTLISGIIPSKSAAKKDPVVALRTE